MSLFQLIAQDTAEETGEEVAHRFQQRQAEPLLKELRKLEWEPLTGLTS